MHKNIMFCLFHFQIAQLDRQKQEYGTQLEEVRFDLMLLLVDLNSSVKTFLAYLQLKAPVRY